MTMSAADTWLVGYKKQPQARARLLCFAHAGGSGAFFRPYINLLAPDVEVCAVELPGQWTRMSEPPMATVQEVVESAGPALLPLFTEKPLALLGHSMGSLLAFELARWLRRHGHTQPTRLCVAAFPAPDLVPPRVTPASHLPDPQFIEFLANQLGAIPPEMLADADLLAVLLPAMRAAIAMGERYQYAPEPPLACSLSLMGGQSDAIASAADLQAWQKHSTSTAASQMFSGGHFFLKEHLQAVASTLRQAILSDL